MASSAADADALDQQAQVDDVIRAALGADSQRCVDSRGSPRHFASPIAPLSFAGCCAFHLGFAAAQFAPGTLSLFHSRKHSRMPMRAQIAFMI
jgi:hypothetical protein